MDGCDLCAGSGWITIVQDDKDLGETSWDVPCPNGCDLPDRLDEAGPFDASEVPF